MLELLQFKLVDLSTMGIEYQNYSHVFRTAITSKLSSSQEMQQALFSTIDSNCDLFISNTFNTEALTSDKIDLDHCFIPTHQTFTGKQLAYICPRINIQLFSDSFGIQNRVEKLRFILYYYSFLGVTRIALEYSQKCEQQTIKTLKEIAKCLQKTKFTIMVIVPLSNQLQEELWTSYVHFRRQLKQISAKKEENIQLILQLGANFPSTKMISKWMGEDVSYVSLMRQAFVLNNKGFPVLVSAHEHILKQFMKKHINLMLNYDGHNKVEHKEPYFHYFTFILKKLVQNMTEREIKAQALIDYLQTPLQPYIDNLDGQTYNIFENDAVKYDQYQLAFLQAFEQFKDNRTIITYYVGAGKGLILVKLMNACKKSGTKVKVYCIEKNPYPIQSLKRRISKNKWSKMVQIVQGDIKEYQMPEKPDIIFSELLGGIGDNELSPECIRWAEKNATPQTIIIPQKYTTFIKPVACHILHKQLNSQEKQMYYTVNFGCHYSPFQSKEVWNFQHPLKVTDNLERTSLVEWQVKENMAIHGFLGSFDCNLYGKAYFSIVPQTLTQNFYSWFPLYFSFEKEELVETGQSIRIEIVRRSSVKQVWYEWRYLIENKSKERVRQSIWHNQNKGLSLLLQE